LPGQSQLTWPEEDNVEMIFWLVVSTPLKNTSQNGNLPQIGLKINNISNHHLVFYLMEEVLLFSQVEMIFIMMM